LAAPFVSFDLSAGPKPEKIYRRLLPAVMTLEVENFAAQHFVGSAVLGLGDDIAITAWHVVSDARCVWAVFADGERIKVTGVIDYDGKRDLALLKLEKALPGRKAPLCRTLQPVATRVYVIGAPKGYGFSIADGLVSQIRQVEGIAQYQVSCPISSGNSGGPILNERGEVIGITSWTKSDAQNLSFAVASREIEALKNRVAARSWDDIAFRAPASAGLSSDARGLATGQVQGEEGFDSFTKRLEQSAGKEVTVIVKEGGKENRYTFTVPPKSK
jgi:S1-C subfamily serine protease